MTDADTLRLLQDAAASFAKFDGARVRSWRQTPPGFDRDLWTEMAGQGWFGILVSEEAGGLGLDLDAAAVIARALGAAAAPEPFVAGGVMAPYLLSNAASGPVRNAAMQAVISGETIACLAWQSPTGSPIISDNQIFAEGDGDNVRLSGEARFVAVPNSDAFIVFAARDGEPGLYWVPATSEGLSVKSEEHADGGAGGWLTLSGVAPGKDACLASGAQAASLTAATIDVGIVANCAELLGVMDRALDLTLDYLKTREQFGQAIGTFQVLQHRSVDLWMLKAMADHATNAAIVTLCTSGVSAVARGLAASSAKARVGEVASKMANETVQLHGAIGFTDEYDLGLYVNRTLVLVPFLGNAVEHRKRYGDLKQVMGEAA